MNPDEAGDLAPRRRAEGVRARLGVSDGARLAVPAWVLASAPIALPVLLLASLSIRAVYDRLGHPGAALDDSFIHFQYARAIAEGHPFRFEPGEPRTMGATSALWPLLLAPFYLLGLDGLSILWPAWVLSFVALGFLTREVVLLALPLAGRHAAVGAGAMTLAFAPFLWCAGSGMEVVPFTLCVVRAVRRSSEWFEGTDGHGLATRTRRREGELLALAFLAPLFRPEGALASLVIACALFFAPRAASQQGHAAAARARAALALLGAVTPQLLSGLVTGHFQSNTAQVKLLPGNPYYVGPALWAALGENLHTLVHVLLNGEIWSAEFLPHGSMPVAFAGLAAVAWCGEARGRETGRPVRFRWLAVLALALAIAVPCAYVSFLWNRLRYLWPFAPFWLVGLACLSRAVGDALGRVRPRWRLATPVTAGLFAGLLASKLEGTRDDLASSASGIDRQQVTLGLWAKEHIPAGARIGVNDTGAIAYFGEHPTFDIVGLTTEGEGRYWVAGAASRFEHYEVLAATRPTSLPRYFIVYPEWMALSAVLGPRLHEVTVTDSSILGGQTMVVYEADYALLGSGERPWTHATGAEPVDALDVADLESEASHGYELLGASDGDELVTTAASPDGALVADGGRRERARERFRVSLGRMPGAGSAQGIVRLEASEMTRVHVLLDGREAASFTAEPGGWQEASFALHGLPPERPTSTVELVPDAGTLTTYHYWFFPPEP